MAAEIADRRKALNPVVLDVSGICAFADYFVICAADNGTQLKAIADHVVEALDKQGVRNGHIEGQAGSGWILLDYGDVIIHVFLEEAREVYGLERLWGDAENVDITAGQA